MSDTITTRKTPSPTDRTQGIGEDYDTRYGFHDDESAYDFK